MTQKIVYVCLFFVMGRLAVACFFFQQPTWRLWGEEKADGALYTVYLKKVRYHRPTRSLSSSHSVSLFNKMYSVKKRSKTNLKILDIEDKTTILVFFLIKNEYKIN